MTFWTKEKCLDFVKDINIDEIGMTMVDSYDENKIGNNINSIGRGECFSISLQLSLIGYGNQIYGKVNYKGEELDIVKFFEKNKIKYKSKKDEKLEPGDLTPRRLIRFFRYNIHEYIKNKGVQSYLFKKYCPNKTLVLSKMIHPGIEYMIDLDDDDSEEVVKNLRLTYKELDKINGTNIYEKINRILVTRGFTK